MSSGDFFRVCRWLHGYLSAFAFLSLMLFSATGLILNHPGRVPNRTEPIELGGMRFMVLRADSRRLYALLVSAALNADDPG